jgi:hypothetical protein
MHTLFCLGAIISAHELRWSCSSASCFGVGRAICNINLCGTAVLLGPHGRERRARLGVLAGMGYLIWQSAGLGFILP